MQEGIRKGEWRGGWIASVRSNSSPVFSGLSQGPSPSTSPPLPPLPLQAASMQRMLKGGLGRPDFDPELGGAESALTKLAAKLVHPDGAQVWGGGGGGAREGLGRGVHPDGAQLWGGMRRGTLTGHGCGGMR